MVIMSFRFSKKKIAFIVGLFLFAKMTPQYYKIQEDRLFCIWRGKQHAALFYGYGYLIYFV